MSSISKPVPLNKSEFIEKFVLGLYLLDNKTDDGKQSRVVVLIDNASDERIFRLKRELEAKSAEEGLKKRIGLFSILYLVRQFELYPKRQDSESGVMLDSPPFSIAQEPNENEIV
jgi:hypothetical protein